MSTGVTDIYSFPHTAILLNLVKPTDTKQESYEMTSSFLSFIYHTCFPVTLQLTISYLWSNFHFVFLFHQPGFVWIRTPGTLIAGMDIFTLLFCNYVITGSECSCANNGCIMVICSVVVVATIAVQRVFIYKIQQWSLLWIRLLLVNSSTQNIPKYWCCPSEIAKNTFWQHYTEPYTPFKVSPPWVMADVRLGQTNVTAM